MVLPISTGWAEPNASDDAPSSGPVALVVSLLPFQANREVFAEIEKAAQNDPFWQGVQFREVTTLGDEKVVDEAMAAISELKAVFCLDASCAEYDFKKAAPIFALTRSEPLADSTDTSTSGPPPIRWVSTTPSADSVLSAIERLSPPPRRIGLVYATDDPGNEGFREKFQSECQRRFGGSTTVTLCGIAAAPCRNDIDMKMTAERCLASLEEGDLVVALPSGNALKFAFVFRNYARDHRLGLVGVGSFPGQDTVCHVLWPSQALAFRLLKAVNAEGKARDEEGAPQLKPHVQDDVERLSALGYQIRERSPER
ncbi:hypothetical protein HQ520_18490 [bacterium]|nr:hypothetical protein [bacterium]